MGGVGGFSKVATFNHVLIIPSFQICGYVLDVNHISCVITNCGQRQWAIPSLLSIALEALLEENITRKLLSFSLDLFFKISLFQVTFLIFFSIAVCSPYFLLVGLLLQYVALFQSQELVKQGSTLTVVRLGIPSSFCCRTTWIYVYGCPLVKLRKLYQISLTSES